jgi:hypothetical protein
MKQSELINQVKRDLSQVAENADISEWLNRCLDDLTPVVKKETKTTYSIISANSYTLPNDFYDFAHVIVASEPVDRVSIDDSYNKGYKVWSGNASLQHGPSSGDIELYYYRRLNRLVNADDVPEVDEPFHDLLILYALGHLQFTEEEYEDRPDALQRYYRRKEEYASYLQRKNSRGRVREKVRW